MTVHAANSNRATGRTVSVRVARRVAFAMTLAGLLAACGTGNHSTRPLPPESTSPEALVGTYLAAAKIGDCSFTRALTLKSTGNWCHDPQLLAYRSIEAAQFTPASEVGVNEECVPFEIDTHGSSDGSMPTGWQPWSLCLVQTKAGWRVRDQGQG